MGVSIVLKFGTLLGWFQMGLPQGKQRPLFREPPIVRQTHRLKNKLLVLREMDLFKPRGSDSTVRCSFSDFLLDIFNLAKQKPNH